MTDQFGKIQSLTLRGYKSIREIDRLPLRDLNIVIGQNGAGKSNFIGLFRLLSRLAREELQDYVVQQGGLNNLLFFGPKVTGRLEIAFYWSGMNSYRAVLVPTIDGSLLFKPEDLMVQEQESSSALKLQLESQFGKEINDKSSAFIKYIENWRVYHFHDTSEHSPLRSSASMTEPEMLQADGGNLAAFLYFLQEKHRDSLRMVLDAVRSVAPFIGSLVLRPEALNTNLIRLRWHHVGREELFDVSDLSDGTLRFIALTALLLQPDPPSTLVLDEPELGLHPAAITQLAALMHQVAPKVQIIAATQSPTFANQFGWEDFIVVDREDDASRFRRLTEEEVAPWAEEFGMGDIWEKNLVGGRP
jgi:predicted ATPase